MPTEITCVIPDASDPDSRLDCVGGPNWTKGEHAVIAEIETGARYVVKVDGMPIPVKVVVARHGRRKYLKTVADDVRPVSLLSLHRCSSGRP
jgi:Protein of unknown function (DUF3892)